MVVISKFTEEPEPYRVSEMIIILLYLLNLNSINLNLNSKLIRTTYWTRKEESKRADEAHGYEDRDQQSWNGEDNKAAEFETNEFGQEVEIDYASKTAYWQPGVNKIVPHISNNNSESSEEFTWNWNTIKIRLLSLVCGIESHESEEEHLERQKKADYERRMKSFKSLNQSTFEKIILNANLVLILCIAVGLYIFFSIPPQLTIFKNVSYNQTIVN